MGSMENIDKAIDKRAIEILKMKRYRSGIRVGDLCELLFDDGKLIAVSNRRVKKNAIKTRVYALTRNYPNEVYRPEWGLIRHVNHKVDEEKEEPEKKVEISEEAFYQPFADWLVNDVGDCTEAYKLGGKILKDKWGTPDVIGIRKLEAGSVISSVLELTTAEIKVETTPKHLLPAFGQASAYKLFSHRVYLVIPKQAKDDVKARIERLCMINGIGLILFNNTQKEEPGFEVKIRATRQEPDYFYLDKFARDITKIEKFKTFFSM